jgi:hypothetical protein
MTIQLSPNNPNLPSLPGGDDITSRRAHHADGANATNAADPSNPYDLPPNELGQSAHRAPAGENRVPLALPPQDKTGGQAGKDLNDKFLLLLDRGHDAAGSNSAQNGGNDGGADDNGGGNSDGGGSGGTQSTHHFSIEDVMQLLVTESGLGFKMSAMQTQLATEQKVGALDDEISQIRGAGKDRKIGSILSNVGTMALGFAQVAGAGVSLKGVTAAADEIDNTANAMEGPSSKSASPANEDGDIEMEDLSEGNGGENKPLVDQPADNKPNTLDPVSRSQMFNRLTAKSQAISQMIGGLGQMTQGGLNVGQAEQESKATQRDAAKTNDEKDAAIDDSLHDNAQNFKQQLLQAMQDYVDRGKNLEQSQSQTMKDIMHSV